MNGPILTLPNAITCVRLLALPFALQALRSGDRFTLAVLLAVMAASDFLDGFLARFTRQVSDWGKLLDPLADKICVLVLMPAAVVWGGVPVWAAVLVCSKDILIAVGGGWISRRAKIPITPNFWGKAAIALELGAFVAFCFGIRRIQDATLFWMALVVVVSGLLYGRVFWQVAAGRRTVPEIVAGYSSYGLTRGGSGSPRLVNAGICLLCAIIVLHLLVLLLS